MSDERGQLIAFDWQEFFPWTNLAKALRLAVQARVLILAAVALVGTVAGWRLCGSACGALFLGADDEVATAPLPPDETSLDHSGRRQHFEATIARLRAWPWEAGPAAGRGESISTLPLGFSLDDNPVVRARNVLCAPLVGLFDPAASLEEFVFLLLCAVWELVVWAFFGAAITRFAAVGLARDEMLSWSQVTGYARGKWMSYFTAPLFPLAVALMAALPLALFGLLLRFELGMLVAGILWFGVLLDGLFMAVLLIGLYFGWPLMWATISVEGTDSFDALSRSYAYTFQRPLQYFCYFVLAALLGALGWLVVTLFAGATIVLGGWAASWFSGTAPVVIPGDRWAGLSQLPALGADPNALGVLGQTGLTLIGFWINVAVTLATSFALAYFWTSTTAIYFLLRRHVDATELDEVFLPEEREPYGLPPLETDPSGVVGVADEPNRAATDGPAHPAADAPHPS